MTLVDLWTSIESQFPDGLPHPLGELRLPLVEGDVSVEIRYSKTTTHSQAVEVTFADSKEKGMVMGQVEEENWFTAEEPYFLLSPQYKRIYFSRNKDFMRDYLTAKKDYKLAEERLEKAFKTSQAAARADLKRYSVERDELEASLVKMEESWTSGGWFGDRVSGLTWEKVYQLDAEIAGVKATLNSGMGEVDISYSMAIRTSGLASLDLSKITGAVATKKRELMGALGVLPKTKTLIPVSATLNLVVSWRDS